MDGVVQFGGRPFRQYDERRYFVGFLNGKVTYLHRAIWEKANGSIPKGFHVHHKDGDPENNDLDNLELLSACAHAREHGLAAPHLKSEQRRALLDSIRAKSIESKRTPESRQRASDAARRAWEKRKNG